MLCTELWRVHICFLHIFTKSYSTNFEQLTPVSPVIFCQQFTILMCCFLQLPPIPRWSSHLLLVVHDQRFLFPIGTSCQEMFWTFVVSCSVFMILMCYLLLVPPVHNPHIVFPVGTFCFKGSVIFYNFVFYTLVFYNSKFIHSLFIRFNFYTFVFYNSKFLISKKQFADDSICYV